jgi:hypothetical protein
MREIRYLTKDEIETVACPTCKALINARCTNPDRTRRRQHHATRVNQAAIVLDVALPHQVYHRRGRSRAR